MIHSWLMMPRSTIPQSQPPPPPLPPVGSALYHRTAPTAAEKAGLTDVGDLFRCIWCREAFSTMANLSNHIKEVKHGEKDKNLAVQTASSVTTTAAVPHATGQSKNESNKMHTSSTPRKLVRGQDVWLGKGEEQTR